MLVGNEGIKIEQWNKDYYCTVESPFIGFLQVLQGQGPEPTTNGVTL